MMRYDMFMEWCKKKSTAKVYENVMLVYFSESVVIFCA